MIIHNKERVKLSYAKLKEIIDMPNLIEVQKNSFEWFLKKGLKELFEEIFPIQDFTGNLVLEFKDYSFDKPEYTPEQCRDKDMHYSCILRMKFRLLNKETGEIKENEILFSNFPIMTENGTFIINGAERAVVSQLSRSPGVYFKEIPTSTETNAYIARILPYRGVWVEIELDTEGAIFVKMERTRKIPVTILLKCLGFDTIRICKEFGEKRKIENPTFSDVLGNLVEENLTDRVKNEIIPCGGKIIDEELAKKIELGKVKQIELWIIPESLRKTFSHDHTETYEDALLEIYRRIRPGEPPTVNSAKTLLNNLFFNYRHYDLGQVGRYKINKKLNKKTDAYKLHEFRTLQKEDFVEIVRYLIKLSNNEGEIDDIDHLGNRRVRSVGELIYNQFRVGLLRMEKIAKERMMIQEKDVMTPLSLINIRPLHAVLNEFFGTSQLSQFMDQVNPLAEITHKRRLSALGPGGLTRERAGVEVRDVHHTHYGRICPIETPEGPNIGLINSLSTYARTNELGFIETPYRKVKGGKVSDEIVYLTADEEDKYIIAQANTPLNENGSFKEEKIVSRHKKEILLVPPERVDYMDVSPKQIVSISASLIPFLEHDDANRALMGSNMQRQAVPLIKPESMFVSTGIEGKVASDSGAVVKAKSSGNVVKVDSNEIIIQTEEGKKETYFLRKFARSNQCTCINQKPIVREGEKIKKSQVIADGPCTERGELALGRNVLVAFMPWEGYNFEDAIIINERLIKEDIFTSLHIEEYETEARDTKLGPEEITRDTPNLSEGMLKDLDENGIVRIGAEVKSEDILVGKITPKGETELTPEEKLLRAIFGEKAREMRDTSLRVPHGGKGKVIQTKVFRRDKGDELSAGVNTLVRVYVAERRKIAEGDKMAGRHGNKGVISRIFPQEDMPYLPDGTPVDIILNPLGVPGRMNIGQILEAHLGWASYNLGIYFITPVFDGAREEEIKQILGITKLIREGKVNLYEKKNDKLIGHLIWDVDTKERLEALGKIKDIISLLRKTKIIFYNNHSENIATLSYQDNSFDEILESIKYGTFLQIAKIIKSKESVKEIKDILENSHFLENGKTILFNGKTGEPFDQEVTVGYLYMMKLIHLVDDKIHARSTGPYALVTQQPLGGKAQFGGQRFGEMEVWALEAYGAASILQELLTVKSDDVLGRVKTYESIIKGQNIQEPGIPESFKVLVKELQGLGIDVKLLYEDKKEIPIPETNDEIVSVGKELEEELK